MYSDRNSQSRFPGARRSKALQLLAPHKITCAQIGVRGWEQVVYALRNQRVSCKVNLSQRDCSRPLRQHVSGAPGCGWAKEPSAHGQEPATFRRNLLPTLFRPPETGAQRLGPYRS